MLLALFSWSSFRRLQLRPLILEKWVFQQARKDLNTLSLSLWKLQDSLRRRSNISCSNFQVLTTRLKMPDTLGVNRLKLKKEHGGYWFDRELRISVGWLGNARSMGQWIKKKHINYEYLKKDLILEGGFIWIKLPVKANNGLGRFVFVTAPNQKCIAPNEGLVNGLVFNIDEENDENSF